MSDESKTEHEWFMACFSYAEWLECTCGFRPQSEVEKLEHDRSNGNQ